MREGWFGDSYLVLFDESEVPLVSERYAISTSLPGYQVLGLLGWDDFIVKSSAGQVYSVPMVPVDSQYLIPFQVPSERQQFDSDSRYSGRIKWYKQPIAFGGDAALGENLVWLSHEEHSQLVRWWNDHYRSLGSRAPDR